MSHGWVQDGDMRAREHFVYEVFDADGRVLYIGRTKAPETRWATHRRNRAQWLTSAARCRQIGPFTYHVAHRLESRLIFEKQPPFNIRGLRGTADPRSISTGLASA